MKTPQEQDTYLRCLGIAEQHYRNIAGYTGDKIVKMADELYAGVVSEHPEKEGESNDYKAEAYITTIEEKSYDVDRVIEGMGSVRVKGINATYYIRVEPTGDLSRYFDDGKFNNDTLMQDIMNGRVKFKSYGRP